MTTLKWTKRILKWFFGTILTLVLLISLGLYLFKDDIIQYAIGEINKHLKTKVEISSAELTFWSTFPNLSIDFNDVFIQDALPNSTRRDTLLFTDQIRLKFDPMDIWNEKYLVKKIDIAPGTLKLKVTKEGKVNYDIFKPSESNENTAFELTLEQIDISQLRFKYANLLQEQIYATTFQSVALNGNFTDKKFTLFTDAEFTIHRIQNGLIPFIINQPATTSVAIFIDKEKQTVSLPNGLVELAGLPFQVNVQVDSNSVHAGIKAEKLALQEVANKLAVKEVNTVHEFQGSGTASFYLNIDSELGNNAYPKVDCSFSVNRGKLREPTNGLSISAINVDGYYSALNGKGSEALVLKNISFNTLTGPFAGNLSIRKFQAPIYRGNASGVIDLNVIHALFHLPKIDLLNGKIAVDSRFSLHTEISDAGNNVVIDEGNGSAFLNNVNLQLEKDSRKFQSINGKLILDKRQAALENLTVRLGKSDLKLNGIFDDIDGFLQNKGNLNIEVTAQSTQVDLTDFTNTVPASSPVSTLTEWMLPEKIAGDVRMEIGKIQLDAHTFSEVHGNMIVGNRLLQINQLHGITAEANVSGSLVVQESKPEYFEVITNLSSKNIHFKPLFKEWNNFDQKVITADNISGRAEVILDLKAPFDMRKGIDKSSVIAQIQLKVFDGNLKNVSTFKQLTADLKTPKTRLVLKPKEVEALEGKLMNIQFSTLENTIFIKNSAIFIPKMRIASNALDITTEGSHTFNNQIDYKFSFRLRELKLKKDESEFGEVIDDETGIRVYVRMFGSLDSPTIVWDEQARKDQAKENREIAKQEAMSILKSEFGLFKKDTTVKAYQQKIQQREEIKIEFGKEETVNPAEEKKKTNAKLQSLKDKAAKLKQKQQEEKGETFTVE